MNKVLETAIYSIPKLDINAFCKANGINKNALYQIAIEAEDETIGQLFLNRYPRKIDKNLRLDGENIIKEILKIQHLKLSELAQTYGVSKRTLLRVIKKVEAKNPELYQLYKRFRSGTLSSEDNEMINSLPVEDIQTQDRSYPITKIVTTKTHDSETVFKSEDDIREEIYEKIAEDCEDPEELERRLNEPDTEARVKNRYKKEQVLIRLFEEECANNLELFHIELGNQDTVERLKEEFRKIDEEDGMLEIIKRASKFSQEKGE